MNARCVVHFRGPVGRMSPRSLEWYPEQKLGCAPKVKSPESVRLIVDRDLPAPKLGMQG